MKGGARQMPNDPWRQESDHRTMTEAAEIQADHKRMVGVKKQHRKIAKAHSLVGRQLMQAGRR